MKVAIVISGEYRTFSMCRPTMSFVDDLDNDIYVTTWDKSVLKSPYLNIDINEDITLEKIKSDLGREAVSIEIEDLVKFTSIVETKINQRKMTHRWYNGLQLVNNSRIEYDFICILRPDMFFHTEIPRTKLSEAATNWNKDFFYCHSGPGSLPNTMNLNDFMIVGSPRVLNDIITEDLGIDYCRANDEVGGLDWHQWWYKRVIENYKIERLPNDLDFSVLGRPQPNVVNWDLANMYSDMWLHSQIVEHIDEGGLTRALKNWKLELIDKALSDIKSRVNIK